MKQTKVTLTEQDIPRQWYNILADIDEALLCKEEGKSKAILFNLSGNGYLDLTAYDDFLNGKLVDYEYPEEKIKESLAKLPKI